MAAVRRRCKPISYLRLRHWCGKTLLSGTADLPTILPMLDYKDIRLLTPAERAEREAQLRAERELEHQRLLDELDAWESEHSLGGRPEIVLSPEIAQRVLADLKAGYSDRAIEAKYAATPWRFSARWLARAKKDGRLYRMAGLRQNVRRSVRQNSKALAPV